MDVTAYLRIENERSIWTSKQTSVSTMSEAYGRHSIPEYQLWAKHMDVTANLNINHKRSIWTSKQTSVSTMSTAYGRKHSHIESLDLSWARTKYNSLVKVRGFAPLSSKYDAHNASHVTFPFWRVCTLRQSLDIVDVSKGWDRTHFTTILFSKIQCSAHLSLGKTVFRHDSIYLGSCAGYRVQHTWDETLKYYF